MNLLIIGSMISFSEGVGDNAETSTPPSSKSGIYIFGVPDSNT
ncbi:hypothetical protein ALQ61_200024 [Pseudomonas coronafaciens pv. zizaniae]|nr:hypothetical protein ALQ61_200024 [Pseudomonas coronafaciens pv. zizaniae]